MSCVYVAVELFEEYFDLVFLHALQEILFFDSFSQGKSLFHDQLPVFLLVCFGKPLLFELDVRHLCVLLG